MNKILTFLLLFGIQSCDKKEKSVNNYENDLRHVRNISNCDSLRNDSIFKKYDVIKWPSSKPRSIAEAMVLLDSAMNEFMRHRLKTCPDIGLLLRLTPVIWNDWVEYGDEHFREQLYDKLRLNLTSEFSLIIIHYYQLYLSENKVNLAKTIQENSPDITDSQKDILLEYEKVDREINELK